MCAAIIARCLLAPLAIGPQLCLVSIHLLHMSLTQAMLVRQGRFQAAGVFATEACSAAVNGMAAWLAEVSGPPALMPLLEVS